MGPFKTIQFTGPATSGSYLKLSWTGSGGSVVDAYEYFTPTRAASFQSSIGTTATIQATYYASALSTDFAANFTVTSSDGFVYVASTNTSNPISASTNSSNIVFDTVPTSSIPTVEDLLLRSPYIFTTTGSNFDTTTYTIRAWEGHLTGSSLEPISYYKTKQKVVNTQQNIWINLNHLLREDFEANIGTYFSNTNNYTSSFDLGSGESKWVRVDTTKYITGIAIDTVSNYFYTLDGYLYPTENQGIGTILMTGTERVISDTFPSKLYFKNNEMVSMSFTTNLTNTPVTCSLTSSQFNTGYVKSVNVYNAPDVDWVQYNWVTTTGSGSVKFTYDTECKYEPYTLLFKNKSGVLENIPVNKKSSKGITRQSSDYLRSIVNYEGVRDITRHTSKQYNVTGMEDYTVNTSYLPEYMNEPIKQLLLSEEVWLVGTDNIPQPVTLTDNNLTYKNTVNDKLIQYTFRVKLSHSAINNIQ
jgi:hypothetical protein